MSTIAEAKQAIYNRLASSPTFHPASADLFADWTLQSGDIVTVNSGEESYSVPVFGLSMRWNGSPKVTVQSSGSQTRPSLEQMAAQKFNGSSSGGARVSGSSYRSQKKLTDRVEFVVGIDANGKAYINNPGSIVLSINEDSESVASINADRINIGTPQTKQILSTAIEEYGSVVGSYVWEYAKDSQGNYIVDELGNKKRVLKGLDGSGNLVWHNGAAYGIWDKGELSAGIFVEKTEGGTTYTRIKGSSVNIGDGNTNEVTIKDAFEIATYNQQSVIKLKKPTLVSDNFYVNGGDIEASAYNGSGGDVKGKNVKVKYQGGLTFEAQNPTSSDPTIDRSDALGLKDTYSHVQLVNNNDGTATLWYLPATTQVTLGILPPSAEHGWISSGTFSKATSLTPAWSGGATAGAEAFLTISGTPTQNPALNYEIEFGGHAKTLNLYINHGTPTAYYNDNKVLVEKYLSVPTMIDEYVAPSTAGGQPTFTTRYTANGVIDATIAWNQGEASGINTGWDNAEGMVGLPNSGDGSTITFSYPLKVTSGDTVTRRQDTKTYTLRSTRNDAYISVLNPDGESWTNFAHIAHNQYDAGNANRASQITTATVITGDSVNLLDADTVYKFQSEYKDANGNWQTGGTKVFKTKPGTPYEVPVAKGTYAEGWNNSAGKVYIDGATVYKGAVATENGPLDPGAVAFKTASAWATAGVSYSGGRNATLYLVDNYSSSDPSDWGSGISGSTQTHLYKLANGKYLHIKFVHSVQRDATAVITGSGVNWT